VAGQDVKVDGKIDTQRRRTDKILAANSAIAVF
jgi:ribosome-associated protein YbcJ (S4-like RNA binding protein)